MKIQDYFVREDLNTKQKKLIFKLRTRMAEFGENYRGGQEKRMCPLCYLHIDSQDLSYFCPEISNNINMSGNNSDIYNNYISVETVQSMEKVEDYRNRVKEKTK